MILLAAVALIASMWVTPNPSAAGTDGTGTVRAEVRYETPRGNKPLVGVEVWLHTVDGSAPDMYACTDAKGIAQFSEVPAGTDLNSATGVSLSLRDECTDPDFRNPDNGKVMTTVYWRDHHGEAVLDPFVVGDGETVTLRFVAETPKQQSRICMGLWSTWVGTSGTDRHTGTPDRDILNAGGGADRIDGAGGGDIICGGPGADVLKGGRGDDWLFGGSGNDELLGGPGANLLVGGPGVDDCRGGTSKTWECE
jgi:Ca2+-binding RTX toxin-like protein